MKLVPRLLVFGVFLPMLGLVIAVMIAGAFFRRSLVRDVDERLFAQAAVESVSLFDGPDAKPHVHLPKSPLAAEVAAFAPTSTLYDPQGRRIVPASTAGVGEPRPPLAKPGKPRLDAPNAHERALTVGVDRPGEGVYTLHLVASLAPVEATMASFYRNVGGTVGMIGFFLFVVLYRQGRSLTARVRNLIHFVPVLREARLPPKRAATGNDELSELDSTLAEAAEFLHAEHAAQERFLANAAHQLRTPLAVLSTEIDIALRRPRESAELRDALEHARTETDRLTFLARKLLDFEVLRVQEADRSPVDLGQMVRDVALRSAGAAATRGVAINHVTDSSALLCNCDALLVAQAVENLVDNALRFAPAGTAIEVSAKRNGPGCTITVRDEGPGIPAEERANVFEPFFRGKGENSQTGLGLAFVADVARKHGGAATLAPSARGTVVRIELPA